MGRGAYKLAALTYKLGYMYVKVHSALRRYVWWPKERKSTPANVASNSLKAQRIYNDTSKMCLNLPKGPKGPKAHH